jgi:hypothetical protein
MQAVDNMDKWELIFACTVLDSNVFTGDRKDKQP